MNASISQYTEMVHESPPQSLTVGNRFLSQMPIIDRYGHALKVTEAYGRDRHLKPPSVPDRAQWKWEKWYLYGIMAE